MLGASRWIVGPQNGCMARRTIALAVSTLHVEDLHCIVHNVGMAHATKGNSALDAVAKGTRVKTTQGLGSTRNWCHCSGWTLRDR